MALWSIAFLGLRPLASLLDGAVASVAGVRVAGVLLALPALVAATVLLSPVGKPSDRLVSPRRATTRTAARITDVHLPRNQSGGGEGVDMSLCR